MAKGTNEGKISPVYGSEDGYLNVRSTEEMLLDQYLSTYAARVDGYKLDDAEKYIKVTMKISFPTCGSRANAELWAWFIAKTAHASAVKPETMSQPIEGGWVVYMSWPIWKNVKFMESKRQAVDLF